jgi:hypothetical protein
MKKLFILSFESARVDTERLHAAIKTSTKILNWSHYLSDTYFLQSESSPEEISKDLQKIYGSHFRHIVFKLDRGYHGYMPVKHWQWLKNIRNQE